MVSFKSKFWATGKRTKDKFINKFYLFLIPSLLIMDLAQAVLSLIGPPQS